MKLVLTHPYVWPYVRRGSERNLDNTARYLVSRGHDVTVLSSKPGAAATDLHGGAKRILLRQAWVPAALRTRVQPVHTFFFGCLRKLMGLDADVVHSVFYADGYAACLAKRVRRFRTVLQINFVPLPWAFARRLPPELYVLRKALEQSDKVLAISQYVADIIHTHFGVRPAVVPPPIRIEDFPLGAGPADGVPTLLSVADFNARRKGLRVLVKAYAEVKRQIPNLRLRLSGSLSDDVRREVIDPLEPSIRADIEVLGLGRIEDVPSLYQTSSVMVLPSMYEAAGMVLFEAWASGAVAVGTRHGGIPEFITPEVGVLFDPQTDGEETMNVGGLAEAITQAIALSQTPGIRQKCRTYAHRFSWETLGPKIEELYVA